MKLPWNRWTPESRRRRAYMTAAVVLGALLLALPLVPSLRRYARLESM